jgi:hypothetical protein
MNEVVETPADVGGLDIQTQFVSAFVGCEGDVGKACKALDLPVQIGERWAKAPWFKDELRIRKKLVVLNRAMREMAVHKGEDKLRTEVDRTPKQRLRDEILTQAPPVLEREHIEAKLSSVVADPDADPKDVLKAIELLAKAKSMFVEKVEMVVENAPKAKVIEMKDRLALLHDVHEGVVMPDRDVSFLDE